MRTTTTNCRIYPEDNGWVLEHRRKDGSAAVIHKLIKFYKDSMVLAEEVDIS